MRPQPIKSIKSTWKCPPRLSHSSWALTHASWSPFAPDMCLVPAIQRLGFLTYLSVCITTAEKIDRWQRHPRNTYCLYGKNKIIINRHTGIVNLYIVISAVSRRICVTSFKKKKAKKILCLICRQECAWSDLFFKYRSGKELRFFLSNSVSLKPEVARDPSMWRTSSCVT